MTTLAYDGVFLYADTQVTNDELKAQMRKVYRIKGPEGYVSVAFAGDVSIIPAVLEALRAGTPIDALVSKECSLIVTTSKGARVYCGRKSWLEQAPIFVGSGSAAARGAYAVCKDVGKAVHAACEVDLYSSKPVHRVKA